MPYETWKKEVLKKTGSSKVYVLGEQLERKGRVKALPIQKRKGGKGSERI